MTAVKSVELSRMSIDDDIMRTIVRFVGSSAIRRNHGEPGKTLSMLKLLGRTILS